MPDNPDSVENEFSAESLKKRGNHMLEIKLNNENAIIGFVILHYLSIDETYKCIDSIRQYCKGFIYHIVIVDNASPNNTFEMLEKKYIKDIDVTLIYSENNVGFVRGNNLGFQYLKKHFDCDFITLSNNDICLLDDTFFPKIVDYYNKYHFAALGPQIISYAPNSGKCNPMRCNPQSIKALRRTQKKIHLIYLLVFLGVYDKARQIKKCLLGLNSELSLDIDYNCVHENVQIHGCFIVFSRDFIRMRDGLNGGTFLYMEEDILYFEMLRDDMKAITVPDIKVFHKERSATDAKYPNKRMKDLFVSKNKCNSIKVLLRVAGEFWNK